MRWSTTLFSVRGIDVRVHATFAIIVALGATRWGAAHGVRGALFGAAFTLAIFACVLLHELGHSVVAQRFGLKVKEIVLLPIGGIASLVGRPQSPKQEIAIAVAGPLVNVALAGAVAAGLWFSAGPSGFLPSSLTPPAPSWQTFLLLLAAGNVSLAVFNLLPFFPLDGGRVLRAVLSMKLGDTRATRFAAGLGQIAAVLVTGFALYSGQLILALIGLLLFTAAGRERAEATLQHPLSAFTAADVAEIPAVEFESDLRVGEASLQLLRTQQEAFPVVSDGKLLGVVFRDELLAAAHVPERQLQSLRPLLRACPEIPSQLSVAQAFQLLQEHGAIVGVVVTPDYPLGIFSPAQVLLKLTQIPATRWPALSPTPPVARPGSAASEPRKAT